jgi:type III restriction enzyme
MISLLPFQIEAATTIADRYRSFVTDPERPAKRGYGPLPFYQSLQALTGSGKTPILADCVAQMRTAHPIEPIVLWISKAKVVVEQTLANFVDGGKYHHLIDRYTAMALPDCLPGHVEDASQGLILLGTVGTFNSKERGDRRIFEVQQDKGGLSLWDALIRRETVEGVKRPLFIVYDEGHNLTDQQANLLLELKPEAIVVATATPRLSGTLAEIVEILFRNNYTAEQLRTSIPSTAVVEAELVKRQIQLGGYVTAEEVAIAALLDDHRSLSEAAQALHAPFTPKCIYVCKTNIKDDEQKPFASRTAPPIRIWRYLKQQGIDPSQIAVYCDLKVSAAQPLPPDFILYRGGENDYGNFISGNYKHIIFNLSLQEGWDDPECYLAYIDKSMGSELQVEQIIGRVLRQPGAKYFPEAKLNTCGFYIHVDDAGVFGDILKQVQLKLAQDIPEVEIVSTGGPSRTVRPQPPRVEATIPSIYLDMASAEAAVHEVLDQVGDYINSPDAQASGLVAQATQEIGRGGGTSDLTWTEQGQGMPVTVQWLLGRFIERQYPAARAVCEMNDTRFSRLIHVGSRAAKQLETQANALVAAFIEHARIAVFPHEQRTVGEALYDINKNSTFKNSIHPAYSGLNSDELECAQAIDALGWPWYRNPSNGGFALPLLQPGTKRSFFPDFIVWTNSAIWLLDPKGDHLIKDDAGRKIIAVENVSGQLPLKVCLITQGTWDASFNKLNTGGVTAWRLKAGKVGFEKYADIDKLLRRVVGASG